MWWVTTALAAPGSATIELAADAPPFTAIDVRCGPDRSRVDLVDGRATAWLTEDRCRVYFKGGPPAVTVARPGDVLDCSFVEAVADCRPDASPAPAAPPPPAPVVAKVRLTPTSPAYSQVAVKCGAFRATATLTGGVAELPGLPAAPCEATFSAPPAVKVALPAGSSVCDLGGTPECAPDASRPGGDVALSLVSAEPVPFSSVEVVCDSGYRERTDLAVDQASTSFRATLSGVPEGEACKAFLKGGPPVQAIVRAGRSMKCRYDPGQWLRCDY